MLLLHSRAQPHIVQEAGASNREERFTTVTDTLALCPSLLQLTGHSFEIRGVGFWSWHSKDVTLDIYVSFRGN